MQSSGFIVTANQVALAKRAWKKMEQIVFLQIVDNVLCETIEYNMYIQKPIYCVCVSHVQVVGRHPIQYMIRTNNKSFIQRLYIRNVYMWL